MPTSGSTESFFQFKFVTSVPGPQPTVQLYLGRYRVLESETYEQLWLEATGSCLGRLLDTQRVDRDTLEHLALETFRYGCSLRGHASPWLSLTGEELMGHIFKHCISNLGTKPRECIKLIVSCRYTPPPEISYLLQMVPDHEDVRSSSGSSSPSMPGYNSQWRTLAPRSGRAVLTGHDRKASKFVQYKYTKLLRERAQRAASKGSNPRVAVV
mmetsp:Transcript_31974/g.90789  ORF Transcript_31974/g.90789 Transcript_31974/m.90789 type:complete len:212 (-) Transcript_31974:1309-1944(-)|eukprot:CAMPEP_0117656496 /NCGR_PEP_ID=MMETSP0804-20121206/4837_1 /TAXON_ID=1074897 /ORGANISM="Tetraselmis astigmatica, Strain CCMP880" /LENGTH=211 /DNA_ID=CAMNT_0005462905 /DNA_START=537 /DNA_END=1172 /DNA_ORIENTATION=-